MQTKKIIGNKHGSFAKSYDLSDRPQVVNTINKLSQTYYKTKINPSLNVTNHTNETVGKMFLEVQFKAPKSRDIAIHKHGLLNLNRHVESKSLKRRIDAQYSNASSKQINNELNQQVSVTQSSTSMTLPLMIG
jgi:hypothetical protein